MDKKELLSGKDENYWDENDEMIEDVLESGLEIAEHLINGINQLSDDELQRLNYFVNASKRASKLYNLLKDLAQTCR